MTEQLTVIPSGIMEEKGGMKN